MLLILVLLGGSLVCLLVINTTLGASSFRLTQLQKTSASLLTREQSLRQQVATAKALPSIAARARALGMRTPVNTTILNTQTRQIFTEKGQPGAGIDLGAPPSPATPKASAAPSTSASPVTTAKSKPAPAASATAPAPARSGR